MEAQHGTVKWGGDFRIRNYDWNKADENDTKVRLRLTSNAKINNNITVKTRLTSGEFDIVEGTDDVKLDNIYVVAKLGGVNVQAGRFDR